MKPDCHGKSKFSDTYLTGFIITCLLSLWGLWVVYMKLFLSNVLNAITYTTRVGGVRAMEQVCHRTSLAGPHHNYVREVFWFTIRIRKMEIQRF